MAITLRLTKGSELTWAELDENQSLLLVSASTAYSSASISGSTLKLFSQTSTGSVASVTHSYEIVSASYSISSSYAVTASYAENGGGSSDYISNVRFDSGDLIFEGVGSAFSSSLDLGNLLSSSAQIADDISGSFTSLSSSIASDIEDIIDGTTTITSASYSITASYAENGGGTTDTGSLLTTASATNNNITFTKGDSSTFNITVDTGSLPDGLISSSAEGSSQGTIALNGVDVDINGMQSDDSPTFNNLTVSGTLTAQELHTEYTSASIIYESGSTKFGDTQDDVHAFTGSLNISGSSTCTGSLKVSGSISATGGYFFGTGAGLGSTALIYDIQSGSNKFEIDISRTDATTETITLKSGSAIDTGSFFTGSSVSDNSITFQLGDGTSETRTINIDTGSLIYSASLSGSSTDTIHFYRSGANDLFVTIDTGSDETVNTGSLLTTASATNNTLTFTKGDSTTFDVIIDTGSLPDGLLSSSAQIASDISGSFTLLSSSVASDIEDIIDGTTTVTSASYAITASYAENGGGDTNTYISSSVNLNVIEFNKLGGSTDTLTVDTGSGTTDTGSLLTTASATNNILTFTKGDSSTFNVTVDTGSLPNGLLSSSAQIATDISGSFTSLSSSVASDIEDIIDGTTTVTSSSYAITASYALNGGGTTDTGSLLTTASATNNVVTFTKGDSTTFNITIDTGSGGPDTNSYIVSASLSDSTLTFISGGDAGAFDGTIDLSSISVDEAKKVVFDVQVSGSEPNLVKGTPIHIVDNNNGSAIVIAASASVASKMPAHGILMQNINSGQSGTAAIVGEITGVNTSAFNSGDTIYVAANGGYTNVKPTGSNLIQNLGIVKKVDAGNGTGQIFGSGRSNDLPNIPEAHFWAGDSNGVPQAILTSSLSSSFLLNTTDTLTGDLTVTGTLTANTYVVSSSVTYLTTSFSSGSTEFGDSLDDTHNFTGSLDVTGSILLDGSAIVKNVQSNGTDAHKLDITYTDGTSATVTIDTGSSTNGTVTSVGGVNGLTGTVTTSGSIQPDYLSNTNNIILAAGLGSTPASTDEIIFNNSANDVKYVQFQSISLSSMDDDLDHGVTSLSYGDGLTGSASPITSTGTVSVKYSGDSNIVKAATDDSGNAVASTDYILTSKQSDNTVEFHSVDDLPFTDNTGTVTSIATGKGITGGTITTSGEIALDYETIGDNNFIMTASTITSAEDGDHILIADNSDSDIVKKITRSNFVSGIALTGIDEGVGIKVDDGATATPEVNLRISGSNNYIFAGTDDSGGDNIPSSSVIAYSYDNTVRHAFVAELPFTNNQGDITGVNVSQGLTGGGSSGTVSITPDWSGSADNTLYSYPARVTSIADDDIVPFHDDSHGTDRTITFANFKNSVGGDITRVNISTGTGITGPVDTTSGDHTQTIGLDLSELTDMTAAVDGTQDEMILLDASVQKRKRLGEINLGQFNNDQNWTSNTGDITGVTAGLGLGGGGTSGTVTLNVSSSKFISVGSAVHVDLTNATETTGSLTIDDFFFIQDSSGNNYEDKTRKIKASRIKLTDFDDTGFTVSGVVTSVSGGEGLKVTGTTTPTVAVEYNNNINNIVLRAQDGTSHGTVSTDSLVLICSSSNSYEDVYKVNVSQLPLGSSGDITAVTAGDGLINGGTSGAVTVDLGTPGTLSVSSTNATTANSHTHDITTTSAGAASTIVQTDASSNITANNFITTSDKRLKSNIEPIKEGLETLKKFVSYEYELNGKQDAGFIAQEVQEHIPYAVNEKEDGYLAMNTKPILAHIHKAILELDKRLSDIENKL